MPSPTPSRVAEEPRVTAYDTQTAQYVTVPESQLEQAQLAGMVPEAPEETAARHESEQFDTFGEGLKAGAEGLAHGATLGLSAPALRALGADPEAMARRRRLAPLTAGAGEVAGTLLGLGKFRAAGGAAQVGARGLNLLTAPARGAVALGRAAEGATGATLRTLGLTGQSALGRATLRGSELAAGGAVEGGLFGAGQAISEAALSGGNYDDLAERVWAGAESGAGLGALLGGGTGATLGLAGRAGDSVVELLRRGAPGDSALNERALKALGSRGTDLRRLGSEAKVQQLGQALREYRLADGRPLIATFDTAEDIAAKVAIASDEVGAKLGGIRNSVEEAGGQIDARGYLDRVQHDVVAPLKRSPSPTIRAKAEQVEAELAALHERVTAFETGQAGVKKLASRIDTDALSAAERSGSASTRAFVGQLRGKLREAVEAADAGLATEGTAAMLAGDVLAPLMRSPSSKIRKAAKTLMHDVDDVSKLIERPVTYGDLRRQQEALKDVVYPKAPPGGGLPPMPAAHAADLLKAERLLEDTMEAHVETTLARIDPAQAGTYRETRTLAESMIKANKIGKKVGLQNLGNRAISPSDYGAGLFVTAGQLATGDVTAPVQGLIASLVHKNIRERGNSFLVSMADRAKRAEFVMSDSVRKFVRRAADLRRVAIGAAGASETDRALGKMPGEDQLKAVRRITAAIQRTPAHESAAAEEFAPNVARAMTATQTRATSFLKSKLPPALTATRNPLYAPLDPHPSEIQKFARYYDVAVNPMAALAHLNNGTLMLEHADALRSVWPNLNRRIQEQVTVELTRLDRRPTYEQRIMLGTLLQIPTDASLEPMAIRNAQDALHARVPTPPPPNIQTATPMAAALKSGAETLESQEFAI